MAVMLAACMSFTGCGAVWLATKKVKDKKAESGFKEQYEESAFTQEDVDSDTVQWFCSAYAIYTHLNKKDLGMIGGTAPENEEMHQDAIKRALDSGWGITDHESAVSKANWLFSGGHRKKYKQLLKEMKKYGLLKQTKEQVEDEAAMKGADIDEYVAAYEAYHEFGETALDAWDYCRLLQILGDCCQADYISLEECLDVSLEAAKKLQDTFDSWEDVCKSYLYGYFYWSHDSVQTEWRWEIYEELKEMEDGPFSVPYDTELTVSWKNVTPKAKSPDEETEETKEDDEEETESTVRQDSKGRYLFCPAGMEKEFSVAAPEHYTVAEDTGEDYLIFIGTSADGLENSTLFYSAVQLDASYTEENLASKLEENYTRWKEESLHEYLEYQDVQEMEVAGHTVKYNVIVKSFNEKEKGYDRQWEAWCVAEDGCAVTCSGTEVSSPETKISEETIKNAMSAIIE